MTKNQKQLLIDKLGRVPTQIKLPKGYRKTSFNNIYLEK